MTANPAPAPTLEDVIGALQDMTPQQQHTAITLIHLMQTWPDTPAPLVDGLTDLERYMLALFGSLKAEQDAAKPPYEYVHPVIEELQHADAALTDFAVDAWERDPDDAHQVASRYDAARDLVSRALNISRVAIKLDK